MSQSRNESSRKTENGYKNTVESKGRGWLFWAAVLLTAFVALPNMSAGNYLPKSTWAAFWIAAGLFFSAGYKGQSDSAYALSPSLTWLGYMFWCLISILWAPSWRTGCMAFAGMIIMPTGCYLLARQTEFWRYRQSWVVLSLVLLGVTGLCFIQLMPDGMTPFGLRVKIMNWYTGRDMPRGSFGNRNYASIFMALALPLVCYAWYSGQRRSERWLHAVSLACTVITIILLRTRSAWLGLGIALVFMVLAIGWKHFDWRDVCRRFGVAALLILILLTFVLWVMPIQSGVFIGQKSSVFSVAKHLLDGRERLQRWLDYGAYIEPVFGAGYGNYSIRTTALRGTNRVLALRSDIHNDFLQALAESGFPGLVLFVLFWFLILLKVWRGRSDPLVLAAGASVVVVIVVQSVTFMMEKISSQIILASVVAIIQARSPRLESLPLLRIRILRSAWLMRIWSLFMLLVALLAAMNLIADRRFNRWPGETGGEAQAYQRLRLLSVTSVPMLCYDANISHYLCHELQSRALRMGMYQTAERFAEHALALHPNDHGAMGVMAEVALYDGRREDAKRWLNRAAQTAHAEYDAPYAQKLLALRLQDEPGAWPSIAAQLEASLREKGWLDNPYSEMLRKLVKMYMAMGTDKTERANEIWEAACKNLIKPLTVELPLSCNVRTLSKPFPETAAEVESPVVLFRWQGIDTVDSYDLYLWKQGESKPERPLKKNLRSGEMHFKLELESHTTYFWQIELHGKYVDATGPLWYFRTGDLTGKE